MIMVLNLLKIQGKQLQEERNKKTLLNSQLSALMSATGGSSAPATPSTRNTAMMLQTLNTAAGTRVPQQAPMGGDGGGGVSAGQSDVLAQIFSALGNQESDRCTDFKFTVATPGEN